MTYMERWVLGDIHRTYTQVHNSTHSCNPKHTRIPDTEGHMQLPKESHTQTNTYPGTYTYTVTGIPGAFFQRETQGHGHTHRHKHTHTFRDIQTHRHKDSRHNHTLEHRYTKAQAHSVTPWQSHSESVHSGIRRQMSTGKHPQGQSETGAQQARWGHTQAQAEHPQVHPPRGGLTLEHLGTRPQEAGAGVGGGRPSAPGAHGSPAGAPSVRARACVRAATCGRKGARCARGCPAGAARGERLPWRAEQGRILMERPRALPPARLAPSSHAFLLRLLPDRPGQRLGPRTPLTGPEPPARDLGQSGGPGLRDPQRWPRPGESRRRGMTAWGDSGAAWPGRGHQLGSVAGSSGAALEMRVVILGAK